MPDLHHGALDPEIVALTLRHNPGGLGAASVLDRLFGAEARP